jgi:DNA repair exonuclease SbcCD ATPase subunit
MSDSNQPVDTDESNLEDFEAQFYGLEKKEDDFVAENEDNSLETEEDLPEDEEVEEEDEEELPDEEEEEPEPEPEPVKAKKKSFQSRIDEITARAYEAERREALLRQELEALKTEAKPQAKEPTSNDNRSPEGAPSPDAVDEAGELLYPLGEFDPKFISDLTRYTIKVESERAKAEAQKAAAVQAAEEARQEIVNQYAERFNQAADEIPDLREKVAGLADQFNSIDENYGEYLATTIMSLESGPRLMYYLSQNIGEAQKIVASGPAAATLALGRLDAMLSKPKAEEKRKLVSNAPPPPQARARGAHGRFEPNPDTDDLEAFERVFYAKK